MTHLLRINSQGSIQKLEPTHFANEVDELQSYIRTNPAILGDNITIIAEQLDTGSGTRLDILALEEIREGVVRPAIVELKNDEADTNVLLQVLKYSDWALSHTDSVKLYAEKVKVKFTEFDGTSVKVIIVAPAFKHELIELGSYIGGNIDFNFLNLERFKDDDGDIIALDSKTPVATPTSITSIQQEWDWGKYRSELKISPDRIEIGKYILEGLTKLNSDKDWGLTPVFRKYYVALKKFGYNIVEIDLYYAKKTYLSIQLPKPPKELDLPEIHTELEQDFSQVYKRYSFEFTDININVDDFIEYIERAISLL